MQASSANTTTACTHQSTFTVASNGACNPAFEHKPACNALAKQSNKMANLMANKEHTLRERRSPWLQSDAFPIHGTMNLASKIAPRRTLQIAMGKLQAVIIHSNFGSFFRTTFRACHLKSHRAQLISSVQCHTVFAPSLKSRYHGFRSQHIVSCVHPGLHLPVGQDRHVCVAMRQRHYGTCLF